MHRVAIEGRVGKQGRCPAKIHDGEEQLAVVLVDAGAATDDLFELGHRGDALVEDDQVAGLGIHTGAHQARGAGDHRIGRFGVDEVVELSLAFVIIAGDAHDVLAVGSGQVGIGIHQRLTHPLRVVGGLTEDDGLGDAIGGPEKLRDLGRHEFGALFEDEVLVEVAEVVFAVFDELPVPVHLTELGPPTEDVPVEADANHLVGCEEAIGDALAQRVGVNRFAEVFDVGDLLGFLGRGGKADLRRRGEIFQDLPPRRIIGGTAPVTLVHDDEIEEIRRELLVDVLVLLGAGDGLVEAEIDLECLVHLAMGDLRHRRPEGLEIVGLGLVGEDVAIHEEEDAFLRTGLPKPPDDLEGGVGLAGASGHDQQDAVFSPGDGLDRAVDGDELVVAR